MTSCLRPSRRLLRATLPVAAFLLAMAAPLASAQASEAIKSFTTTASTAQGGGHPDLQTSFALENPGTPESAQTVVFEAPQGVFGNTNAISRCTSSDFSLDQCPSNSQAGLITIRANYEGSQSKLLGTAPIYNLVPGTEEPARFAYIAPIVNVAIAIPVTVRTAGDYGLRFTVSNVTQLIPWRARTWPYGGSPPPQATTLNALPKAHPAPLRDAPVSKTRAASPLRLRPASRCTR